MADENIVVHVTHEAVGKIGGIGAVLQGFFTCPSYLGAVHRSILVSPLFATEGPVEDRLGEGGKVLYSSIDGLIDPSYSPAFRRIESLYNVGIVYGRRTFVDEHTGICSTPEVLLIDVRYMNSGLLNDFKRRLFEEFGVQSHLYEHIWDYEQYVRLAPPAIAALKALRNDQHRAREHQRAQQHQKEKLLAPELEPPERVARQRRQCDHHQHGHNGDTHAVPEVDPDVQFGEYEPVRLECDRGWQETAAEHVGPIAERGQDHPDQRE